MALGTIYPVPQGPTIIGWLAASRISPAGAAENVLVQATNDMGLSEIQPSRWDGFHLSASDPQLKLRAIVKSASGAEVNANKESEDLMRR
jgi:hypothetical protein